MRSTQTRSASRRPGRRRPRRRARRGGILLEFALILPLALALITFSVDMGRLVMARTALQDAVNVAARTGARTGNPGPFPSGKPCTADVTPDAGAVSYNAFCQALSGTSLVAADSVELLGPTGGVCRRGADATLFVTVSAQARVSYVTPGLSALLGLAGDANNVRVTATARCEVAR